MLDQLSETFTSIQSHLRVYIILVSLKSPLSVLFLPVATWLLECGTVLGTTLAARKVVFQPRHDGDADAIDGDQRLHVLLGQPGPGPKDGEVIQ